MEWLIFGVVVAVLFASDLLAKDTMGFRAALIRTLIYVSVAFAFGAFVTWERGADDGLKFFTGYILEASLSLDNVFVISLIFGALSIPREYRHRVLLIGILSALVLRGIFIGAGTLLVGRFDWLLLICGAFLVYTGVKLLLTDEEAEVDLERNRTLKLMRRFIPISTNLHGHRFFTRAHVLGGKLQATPLLVALVLVEVADVIFAADSVPATLAVTTDPFLVYTSNIFAILGLRSLYIVLENVVTEFEYVGKAVAVVLAFVGIKVVSAHLLHIEVPNVISLGVVVTLLAGGVLLSLVKRKRDGQSRHQAPRNPL